MTTPEQTTTEQVSEPHLDADGTLTVDPTKPFRLEVIIDNEDAAEYPDNPFTLNVRLGATDEQQILTINGEGSLIEGDVPTQLRALADAIATRSVGV